MEGAVTSGLMAAATALNMNSWKNDELWNDWPKPPKRGDQNWNKL